MQYMVIKIDPDDGTLAIIMEYADHPKWANGIFETLEDAADVGQDAARNNDGQYMVMEIHHVFQRDKKED